MSKPSTLLLTFGLTVSLTVSAIGQARSVREVERAAMEMPAVTRAGVSLDQAVAMVQSKYGARVNRAVTIEVNGRLVHEIRLISSDGRVWTVRVDAATGREL